MKIDKKYIGKAAIVCCIAFAMIVPASATTVKTKKSSYSQPTPLAMLDTFTEGFEGGVSQQVGRVLMTMETLIFGILPRVLKSQHIQGHIV